LKHVSILLDTSFILPSFRIDVGDEVNKVLRILNKYGDRFVVFYSTFNVLEALLVIIREVRRGNIKFDEAKEAIEFGAINTMMKLQKAPEPPQVYVLAFSLYSMGHKDLFDNLLYSVALVNDIKFLTMDYEFKEFIKSNKLNDTIITPKELMESLS